MLYDLKGRSTLWNQIHHLILTQSFLSAGDELLLDCCCWFKLCCKQVLDLWLKYACMCMWRARLSVITARGKWLEEDVWQNVFNQEGIDLCPAASHPYSQRKMVLIKCHLSNNHMARSGLKLGCALNQGRCESLGKKYPHSVKICITESNSKMSVVSQFEYSWLQNIRFCTSLLLIENVMEWLLSGRMNKSAFASLR